MVGPPEVPGRRGPERAGQRLDVGVAGPAGQVGGGVRVHEAERGAAAHQGGQRLPEPHQRRGRGVALGVGRGGRERGRHPGRALAGELHQGEPGPHPLQRRGGAGEHLLDRAVHHLRPAGLGAVLRGGHQPADLLGRAGGRGRALGGQQEQLGRQVVGAAAQGHLGRPGERARHGGVRLHGGQRQVPVPLGLAGDGVGEAGVHLGTAGGAGVERHELGEGGGREPHGPVLDDDQAELARPLEVGAGVGAPGALEQLEGGGVRDRRQEQGLAGARRQLLQPRAQHRHHRQRQRLGRPAGRTVVDEGPGEREREVGVAGRLHVQPAGRPGRQAVRLEDLRELVRGQRRHVEHGGAVRHHGQAPRRALPAPGHRHPHPRGGQPADREGEHVGRGGVDQLRVVEEQQHPAVRRAGGQQVVPGPAAGAEVVRTGTCQHLGAGGVQPRAHRGGHLGQQVGEHAAADPPLGLDGGGAQHQLARPGGGDGVQESGLAHPVRAGEHHAPTAVQGVVHGVQQRRATDEGGAGRGAGRGAGEVGTRCQQIGTDHGQHPSTPRAPGAPGSARAGPGEGHRTDARGGDQWSSGGPTGVAVRGRPG